MYEPEIAFNTLVGRTLVRVEGMHAGSDVVRFTTDTGETFELYHRQNCCESVRLNDVNVVGADDALVGSPIVEADVRTNSDDPPRTEWNKSWTWTFYRLATARGTVTLRWLGESNGYYSEGVSFVQITPRSQK